MVSKLDLRPSNLQLMTWCFQIQYSYLLNRSSASNSQSEISGSAILFTNKCNRHRNIAFLQACQLQIWRLSIANENMRYIIIALESVFLCEKQQLSILLSLVWLERGNGLYVDDLILVFNATFSNISAISWRQVLVVEEAGVPGENQRPWASNW
jgi:hypothetical protein